MSKTVKVEAEGRELILKNSAGDYAIIPKEKRAQVEKMLKDKCYGCIDSLVASLPKTGGNEGEKEASKKVEYAEDGLEVENEDINPEEGGVKGIQDPRRLNAIRLLNQLKESEAQAGEEMAIQKEEEERILEEQQRVAEDKTAKEFNEKSFGQAFKQRRAELGANQEFTWRDKRYHTNYATEEKLKKSSPKKETEVEEEAIPQGNDERLRLEIEGERGVYDGGTLPEIVLRSNPKEEEEVFTEEEDREFEMEADAKNAEATMEEYPEFAEEEPTEAEAENLDEELSEIIVGPEEEDLGSRYKSEEFDTIESYHLMGDEDIKYQTPKVKEMLKGIKNKSTKAKKEAIAKFKAENPKETVDQASFGVKGGKEYIVRGTEDRRAEFAIKEELSALGVDVKHELGKQEVNKLMEAYKESKKLPTEEDLTESVKSYKQSEKNLLAKYGK